MKILMNEQLSPHKYKDNHGYLICTDCIMARTGKQTYTRDDCFGDGDMSEIQVDRKEEDVFNPKTLASFENVPITIEHPSGNVDPDNYNSLSVGYMRDIHKGTYNGQPVMLGTAVITDSEGIEKVESGELTNLSCGYDCDVDDSDHPHQTNIRGNHIALCEIPRAGITHIQDSLSSRKKYRDSERAIDLDSVTFYSPNPWGTYVEFDWFDENGDKHRYRSKFIVAYDSANDFLPDEFYKIVGDYELANNLFEEWVEMKADEYY